MQQEEAEKVSDGAYFYKNKHESMGYVVFDTTGLLFVTLVHSNNSKMSFFNLAVARQAALRDHDPI